MNQEEINRLAKQAMRPTRWEVIILAGLAMGVAVLVASVCHQCAKGAKAEVDKVETLRKQSSR